MNIEAIPYLANIALVMYADGSISPAELALLEEIRKEMRFKKGEYNAAVRMAENGDYKVTPVGSFADQVKNLEQMLQVAYVDDDLSKSESAVIVAFCKLIGITQEQLNRLRNDAVAAIKHAGKTCPSCGATCENDAKFCPKCGTDLASFVEGIQTSFQIPPQGIALEFAESTAASFPKAVELAKKTSGYQTCQRGKKTWYLATVDANQIMDALPLIECLAGLRNKTLYQDGEEGTLQKAHILLGRAFQSFFCAVRFRRVCRLSG